MTEPEPARVLIVCTGNVCRSPFIERVLAAMLPAGSGVVVESAGTGALVGSPMEPRAAAWTSRYAGEPAGFVARQLVPGLVASADLVLTATRRHRGEVATLHPRALSYAFTLRDFADLVADLPAPDTRGGDPRSRVRALVQAAAARRGLNPPLEAAETDIVDPFRGDDAMFVTMAQQVMGSLPVVARALAG
ncbi:MAG: arsenate reductase/protein-tyrosine-phosphatase family protein [Oryzihumus sp.]